MKNKTGISQIFSVWLEKKDKEEALEIITRQGSYQFYNAAYHWPQSEKQTNAKTQTDKHDTG